MPRDIQKIIINARAKERKDSSTPKVCTQEESNPGGSDLPRQYTTKPRANLAVQGDTNADLIEEFLQQALGEVQDKDFHVSVARMTSAGNDFLHA